MIWDPVERTLWGIAISLSLIASLLYAFRTKQKGDNKEKLILIGFTCYLFFNGTLIYFFRYMTDYQIYGFFQNGVYFGDFNNHNLLFELFYRSCAISGGIGTCLWFYTIEKSILKTRYLLTILSLLATIFAVIIPFNTFLIISPLVFFAIQVINTFILLKSAYIAQVQFKIIALFFYVWGLLNVWGIGFHHLSLKILNLIPLFIAPLCIIGSMIVISIPLLVDPLHFPQKTIHFYILILGTIIGSCILILLNLIFKLYNLLFSGTLSIILFIIVQYYLIKNIRDYYSGQLSSENGNGTPFSLGIFTRPQKLTEEEVSIAKEKQICLVCKNRLGGNIYLCSSCGAFYCFKYSDTLTKLENACWVCEEPFDKSKPIKPILVEGIEDVKVESELKKEEKK